jgi:hypothetical protein
MRATTLFIFILLFCSLQLHAGWTLDFKRHNFEISNAVGLDYRFIVRKNMNTDEAQFLKHDEWANAGFCFGLHYTYRPMKWFGFSTGFESMVYGYKLVLNSSFIQFNDGFYTIAAAPANGLFGPYGIPSSIIGFRGYMGIPAFVHAFYQGCFPKCPCCFLINF